MVSPFIVTLVSIFVKTIYIKRNLIRKKRGKEEAYAYIITKKEGPNLMVRILKDSF